MCALRLSTGFRNGLLGASGVCDLLNGGKINIYSGGQPASADYAETGVLLATITTGASGSGLVLGTAAAGVISKSASTWSGTCAVAGIAGWARFYGTAGTTGSSATEVRLDGNVGISGSDFVLANTSLTLGATQTIDTFTLTAPAS
jgi:hypothetical protein